MLVAGAPRSFGQGDLEPQEVVVTGARRAYAVAAPPPPPPPPPPAPGQAASPDIQLPLQPPLHQLMASACVVWGLGG